MATLEEIRATLLPDAVRVTAGPRPGAAEDAANAAHAAANAADAAAGTPPARPMSEGPEVAWVRVLRARVPALDVLEPGDLVIVPVAALPVVAPTDDQQRQLVATLADAPVSGLLLVEADGPGAGTSHESLVAACAERGVAAWSVRGADPGTLERSVIGFLVDRRGELERQAATLEADLARLAMAGHGLEAIAGAIAGFLRRAVALERRPGVAVAMHAPADLPEAAGSVTSYLARPAASGRRLPLPGPHGDGSPAGWLVLLGDRAPTELESVVAERIAPLLALALVASAGGGRGREEHGRGDPMPAGGPPWVMLVARQQDNGGEAGAEALRRELRVRYPARRLALRGTSQSLELRAIVAPDSDDPLGVGIAGQVAALLGRPVGLSCPFSEASRRSVEEAAARRALEVALQLPCPPAVVRADRTPAYRLLATLQALPNGAEEASALLEPLRAGRPGLVRERLATLRALLDHGGPGEAATVLGVHRNTVAYRVRAIEAATGWDLADPDLRLALAVALRIVQPGEH